MLINLHIYIQDGGLFVSWCFKPSQPLRVTSGLNTNFNLSHGGQNVKVIQSSQQTLKERFGYDMIKE